MFFMLKNRLILIVFFIATILPLTTFADVYEEVVPKILEATQISGFHEERIEDLQKQAIKRIELRNIDQKQAAALEKKVLGKIAELEEEHGWAVIKPKFIEEYKKLFTESEIQEIGAFLDSSAGKLFIAKTPLITQELLNESMGKLGWITKEVHQYIDQQTSGMSLKKAN